MFQIFPYGGYDRSVALFSPDGTIVQVEYAQNAVAKAKISMIMKTREGIIFCGLKERVVRLISENHNEKIYKIDEHMAAIISGWLPDGRILVERARDIAVTHRILYDEPASPEEVMNELAYLMQMYTQLGGARPFGVNLMLGVIDGRQPRVMVIGPPGEPYEVHAWAAGSGYSEILEYWENVYEPSISLERGLELVFDALKQVKKKLAPEEYELATLTLDKQFKIYNIEERKELLEKYYKQ
ncbi:MAG: hypothetical protein GXO42_01100 [bacterium]|nr:hypothetical protein [bacterium]